MEVDWVCQRAHLRALLTLHPDWSRKPLADAVGCSTSMVTTWKKRFADADPHHVVVLFSRSRAPHHHPARLSDEVVERIIAPAPGSSQALEAHTRSKGALVLPGS